MHGGGCSVKWAEFYQSRRLDSDNWHSTTLCSDLNQILKENNYEYTVIQIGSSSGREVALLAKNHIRHQFIGTDIYPEVIVYSSNIHRLPNLSFTLCGAKEIKLLLEKMSKSKRFIIFSSGSLQYVQPDHMKIFFSSLKQYEVQIVLLEPVSYRNFDPQRINGSRWRDNFSYTHNYRYYAEESDFLSIKSSIIKPYTMNDPIHAFTGHYYYYGKNRIP